MTQEIVKRIFNLGFEFPKASSVLTAFLLYSIYCVHSTIASGGGPKWATAMPSIHEAIESDESFSSLSDEDAPSKTPPLVNNNTSQKDESLIANETSQEDNINKQSDNLETSRPSSGQDQPVADVPEAPASNQSSINTENLLENSDSVLSSEKSFSNKAGKNCNKGLVEYSDVSSEEFSEPEAGEITDSPSRSPLVLPRRRPSPPARRYPLTNNCGPPGGPLHLSATPSLVPHTASYPSPYLDPASTPPPPVPNTHNSFTPLSNAAHTSFSSQASTAVTPHTPNSQEPLSEGEVNSPTRTPPLPFEASCIPPVSSIPPQSVQRLQRRDSNSSGSGGGTVPPHSLVPYPAAMSPDRNRGTSDYYGRHQHRSRSPPDLDQMGRYGRKKEHKDKKKKKHERKRKRTDRSYSPPQVHKKKKKRKYKHGEGVSPDVIDGILSSEESSHRYHKDYRSDSKVSQPCTPNYQPPPSPRADNNYPREVNYRHISPSSERQKTSRYGSPHRPPSPPAIPGNPLRRPQTPPNPRSPHSGGNTPPTRNYRSGGSPPHHQGRREVQYEDDDQWHHHKDEKRKRKRAKDHRKGSRSKSPERSPVRQVIPSVF